MFGFMLQTERGLPRAHCFKRSPWTPGAQTRAHICQRHCKPDGTRDKCLSSLRIGRLARMLQAPLPFCPFARLLALLAGAAQHCQWQAMLLRARLCATSRALSKPLWRPSKRLLVLGAKKCAHFDTFMPANKWVALVGRLLAGANLSES